MFFQTNNKIAGPTLDLVADFHQVFQYDFMTNAFLAGTVVAILAGVVGYFVVLRRLSFACEALSHGGFAGATGAVVLGQDVFLGLLVFTSVTGGFMGLLGDRIRGRDVAIGGTLAFSLALGAAWLICGGIAFDFRWLMDGPSSGGCWCDWTLSNRRAYVHEIATRAAAGWPSDPIRPYR